VIPAVITGTCRDCAGLGRIPAASPAQTVPCLTCGESGDEFTHKLYEAYLEGRREILARLQYVSLATGEPDLDGDELRRKVTGS
jgi:hypothetical protein